jgi:hypothetical protein
MIKDKLKNEIWDYCRLNDITDVNGFIERMVQQGYNVEKYGNTPANIKPEVIETIVEKEVQVIKEVYVTNDDVVNKLQDELVSIKSKLDLEKKKVKKMKTDIKPPKSNTTKSPITWVTKNERNKDNLYDD